MVFSNPIMARLYTLVPLPQGPFKGVSPIARMVHGMIWDRYKLSQYNVVGQGEETPWYDAGREAVYCVYAQNELAQSVGVSERTVRRALDELREAGLLSWRKAEYKCVCRYYIPEAVYAYLKGHCQ